jgi:hypothetical protein
VSNAQVIHKAGLLIVTASLRGHNADAESCRRGLLLGYQTDIYAGRVLAQAIVREMKANPDFQRDFAEAKAEIAAAQYNLPIICQ